MYLFGTDNPKKIALQHYLINLHNKVTVNIFLLVNQTIVHHEVLNYTLQHLISYKTQRWKAENHISSHWYAIQQPDINEKH